MATGAMGQKGRLGRDAVILLLFLHFEVARTALHEHWSYKPLNPFKAASACVRNEKVHARNTRFLAKVLKGMPLRKAQRYIEDVCEHKRCVPFTRGMCGFTRQAREWGAPQGGKGRWPLKSCKVLVDLLLNAETNAKYKKLDPNSMVITNVEVNEGTIRHRRTFRAFGRVNPYDSRPCHINVMLEEADYTKFVPLARSVESSILDEDPELNGIVAEDAADPKDPNKFSTGVDPSLAALDPTANRTGYFILGLLALVFLMFAWVGLKKIEGVRRRVQGSQKPLMHVYTVV